MNETTAELLSRLWRHARSQVVTLEPRDVQAIAEHVERIVAELERAHHDCRAAESIAAGERGRLFAAEERIKVLTAELKEARR